MLYVSRVNPLSVIPIEWEGTNLDDLWDLLIGIGAIHED